MIKGMDSKAKNIYENWLINLQKLTEPNIVL